MTFDLSDYVGKKVIVNFGINRGVDGHFFLDNVNIDERLASTIKIDISRSPETSCIAKIQHFQPHQIQESIYIVGILDQIQLLEQPTAQVPTIFVFYDWS
ncbi:MAG: hypothetical protein IPH93_12070 [Saprospiraceae bacterium]|nr:hypothetical protein [Saprospiraceae bacterium]